jgi:hypothetical protein
MDLAKIIAELKVELQCLDAVIVSIEELARVQNLADEGVRPATSSDDEPVPPGLVPPKTVPEDAARVKRRRGRPRKNAAPAVGEPPEPVVAGPAQSNDDSTVSAA